MNEEEIFESVSDGDYYVNEDDEEIPVSNEEVDSVSSDIPVVDRDNNDFEAYGNSGEAIETVSGGDASSPSDSGSSDSGSDSPVYVVLDSGNNTDYTPQIDAVTDSLTGIAEHLEAVSEKTDGLNNLLLCTLLFLLLSWMEKKIALTARRFVNRKESK